MISHAYYTRRFTETVGETSALDLGGVIRNFACRNSNAVKLGYVKLSKKRKAMKKFVCMMCLMMITLMAHATAQMMDYSPPEQDIGYEMVATLSLDGQTVASFDSQLNIVDLQTPVMLNQEASTTSAQVVDACSLLTPTGEVSMTLVCYRWPNSETETMNLRNDYTGNYAPDGDAYSFTSSRADFS